jgi:hypothetical protein
MLPLYGGGFTAAFLQVGVFYYAFGVLLHFIVPLVSPVKGIQEHPRKPGEVTRDALHSLGEREAQIKEPRPPMHWLHKSLSSPGYSTQRCLGYWKPSVMTLNSLPLPGPIAVKAAVWTLVEILHERGYGLLYEGPINSRSEVSD